MTLPIYFLKCFYDSGFEVYIYELFTINNIRLSSLLLYFSVFPLSSHSYHILRNLLILFPSL